MVAGQERAHRTERLLEVSWVDEIEDGEGHEFRLGVTADPHEALVAVTDASVYAGQPPGDGAPVEGGAEVFFCQVCPAPDGRHLDPTLTHTRLDGRCVGGCAR